MFSKAVHGSPDTQIDRQIDKILAINDQITDTGHKTDKPRKINLASKKSQKGQPKPSTIA